MLSMVLRAILRKGCSPCAKSGKPGANRLVWVWLLRLLWWALPVVDLMKASVLLAFSAIYALVVAKSADWFGDHQYVGALDIESGKHAQVCGELMNL